MINDSCTYLSGGSESKDGGIPIVLGINIGAGGVILLLFFCLHFCFKDFTMAAVYYTRRKNLLSADKEGDNDEEILSAQRRRASSLNVTKDICESVIKFISLSERDLQKRIGVQGSVYLTLQLYFMAILSVYCFLSIGVILPLNTSGRLQTGVPFAKTTLSNIDPDSPILWTHSVFAVLYFIIGGIFFIHFVLKHEDIPKNTRSVMITRIPKYIHVEDLSQHFEDIFSTVQVNPIQDIKFAYDTHELYKTWKKLKDTSKKLEAAEAFEMENGCPLMIRTSYCSESKVSAKDHYSDKLQALQIRLTMERNNALNSKLSIGFVSFYKEEHASTYVDKYKLCCRRPSSSLSDSINSQFWSVSLAPEPSDILWNNLSTSGIKWWFKWIAINFGLVLFLIFFTTPPVLLNSVTQFKLLDLAENVTSKIVHQTIHTPTFLRSYWSSFLLLLFGFILLFFVTQSVYLENYWSRTQRELVVLRKAYIYKTLQVVVLPSIGLTSLSALGNYLLEHRTQDEINSRLSCIFLPNNGAIFISYIIIATFISNPIELIRLPQLIMYCYGRLVARTRYERKQVLRKITSSNFTLGIQYAYSLLMFTLTATFSLSVPLIVPFGVVFFVIKYFVDKYNLLYAYRPLPDDNNVFIHKTAIKIAIIGVTLTQWLTLGYSVVRIGTYDARSITTLVALVLCNIAMWGVFMYGWFSYLIPRLRNKFGYTKFKPSAETGEQNKDPEVYIAPVLSDSVDQVIKPELSSSLMPQHYESFGRTIAGGAIKVATSPTHT